MSASPRRPLVVVVGMGETGVLTAMQLKDCDVVGVATKRALVSGQELGMRLAAPRAWRKNYLTELSRFEQLKPVKMLIGRVVGVELDARVVRIELADGSPCTQSYDYLVIATGVTNGFWRDDRVLELGVIEQEFRQHRARISRAKTIAIVGGGATGTSVAAHLAIRHKRKQVHFFHSGELPLQGYPDTVRSEIAQLLAQAGVHRWPHHRADPDTQALAAILRAGTIRWQTGQPPFPADAILWATGATRPNSSFLPPEIIDEKGFVLTEPTLQVRGWPNAFAIGDVAQTDHNRSSARNWAYRLVAENISSLISGHPERMKPFEAPEYRWGSILGTQKDGLTVFLPTGEKYHMSRRYVKSTLFPIKVKKEIYGGVKPYRRREDRPN